MKYINVEGNKELKNLNFEKIKNYFNAFKSYKEEQLENPNKPLFDKRIKLLNNSGEFKLLSTNQKATISALVDLELTIEIKDSILNLKNNLINKFPKDTKSITLDFETIEDRFIQAELFKMELLQADKLIENNIGTQTIDDLLLQVEKDEGFKRFVNYNCSMLSSRLENSSKKEFKNKDNLLSGCKKWIRKSLQIDIMEANLNEKIQDIHMEQKHKEESIESVLMSRAHSKLVEKDKHGQY